MAHFVFHRVLESIIVDQLDKGPDSKMIGGNSLQLLKIYCSLVLRGKHMTRCFFVSDLHGSLARYRKLFNVIRKETPNVIFMGGDLLPSGLAVGAVTDVLHKDFINDFLVQEFEKIKAELGNRYPRVFVILGNDDPRFEESSMLAVAAQGLWEYINERCVSFEGYSVYGYSYVPPTPFMFKDWERYDVSRYVDPGCISPEEGSRSVPISQSQAKYLTISGDIQSMTKDHNLEHAIFLFHSPPYRSVLDRAALDGKMIDYVPLDVHVGSIAIQRFIEERQPLITLHGHIHESARITGMWKEKVGRTHLFGAAHDESELALVSFDLKKPSSASRRSI